jgi:hypothetical protein
MPLAQTRHQVTVGQRYRPVAGRGGVWIVVGLTADHAGNPHARLILESDRTRVMTIAFAGLQDRRLYEQLTEIAEHDDGRNGKPTPPSAA